MGVDGTILPILAVIFLATLIRSAFGFGEALVAVPLLSLLIPVEQAVPLATLSRSLSRRGPRPGLAQDSRPQCRLAYAFYSLRHSVGPVAADGGGGNDRQGNFGGRHHRLFGVLSGQPQSVQLKNDRLAWVFGFVCGVWAGLME